MANSVYKQKQWKKSKPLSENWYYQYVIGVLSVSDLVTVEAHAKLEITSVEGETGFPWIPEP